MTSFKAVADRALLVEFGTAISPEIHAQVVRLDRLLALSPPSGLLEVTPAYANLMISFDPVVTDHQAMTVAVQAVLTGPEPAMAQARSHDVAVCYDPDLGTDLAQVAQMKGMSTEAVTAAHLAADYRVYLYGFAPGYAYLAGTPAALHLPRKTTAVRDIPAGRVIIAGPQCIVTTLKMPTGWWIIGSSPTKILRDGPQPFLFAVGDTVRFHRISRQDHDAL